jgi:myo-inositol-1(or 4)-monophosphatase
MEKVKTRILKYLAREKLFETLKSRLKDDNTLVTEIDLFVCRVVKEEIMGLPGFKDYAYFSEEDYTGLSFPSLILDPIDGTRELIKGIGDCAMSLALMPNGNLLDGWGWIFNPFTGFSLCSEDHFVPAPNLPEGKLNGMVSLSEWNRGLYDKVDQSQLSLCPRGSIALKLGLLAAGACDFVVTKRNKRIWDIAGGTLLCARRKINLYGPHFKFTSLQKEIIDGPLLWCREESFERLKFLLG